LPCGLILASGTPVNHFWAHLIEPGGFLSMGECQFQPQEGKHKRESDQARSAGG